MTFDAFLGEAKQLARQGGALAEKGAVAGYNFAIGDDIKTLRDPNASKLDRALAVVSIASNFVGPEGKLAGRGLAVGVKLGEHLLEHGGVEVVEHAAVQAEKWIGKHSPLIEKTLARAATVAGVANVGATISSQAQTAWGDLKHLVQPHETRAERVAAVAKVAVDAYGFAKDYEALHHGYRAAVPAKAVDPRSVVRDATRSLDGAREVMVDRHAIAETERARFDARGGATVHRSSFEMLREQAAKGDKPMIVIGAKLNHETRKALADAGVHVAAGVREAAFAARLMRVPGVERALLEAQSLSHGVVGQVYEQHHRVDKIRDAAKHLEAPAQPAPGGIGIPHPDAPAWSGKPSFGTVTYVEGDRVEQYIGNHRWVAHDLTALDKSLAGRQPAVGDFLEVQANGRAVLREPAELTR